MNWERFLAFAFVGLGIWAVVILVITLAVLIFAVRQYLSIRRDHNDMRQRMRRRRGRR